MGDTQKFRAALAATGYNLARYTIFNDKHKHGTRRLKLWAGSQVFESTPAKQQKLEQALIAQFGRRYITGQYIARPYWVQGGKSLVIFLAD